MPNRSDRTPEPILSAEQVRELRDYSENWTYPGEEIVTLCESYEALRDENVELRRRLADTEKERNERLTEELSRRIAFRVTDLEAALEWATRNLEHAMRYIDSDEAASPANIAELFKHIDHFRDVLAAAVDQPPAETRTVMDDFPASRDEFHRMIGDSGVGS